MKQSELRTDSLKLSEEQIITLGKKIVSLFIDWDNREQSWCELCGYTWFIETHNWKWFLKRQTCQCSIDYQKNKFSLGLLAESNITKKELAAYSFSDYIWTACNIQRLMNFVRHDTIKDWEAGSWLYLYWWVWTWKSYSSILACIIWIVSGYSALYYPVTDLLDDLRPNSWKVYADIMSDCETCDILVLDDIWQEKESQWVAEILYQIINKRYREWKKTILTANKTIDEIWQKYDKPAIASRLSLLCSVVTFGNRDKRA